MQEKQPQIDPHVAELNDLLNIAIKSAPDLWKAIEESLIVSELTAKTLQDDKTYGFKIYSDLLIKNP